MKRRQMTSAGGPGKKHWAHQTTPQHARETAEDFQALAAELRLLFADCTAHRILEIGCSNGAMFTLLGVDIVNRYVGVDSPVRCSPSSG